MKLDYGVYGTDYKSAERHTDSLGVTSGGKLYISGKGL